MPLENLTFIQRLHEHGFFGYLGLMLIAGFAGTVKYIQALRPKEKPTFLGWVFSVLVSGFVGLLVAMICQYYQLDYLLTGVITGVAAHNGSQSLKLLHVFVKKGL